MGQNPLYLIISVLIFSYTIFKHFLVKRYWSLFKLLYIFITISYTSLNIGNISFFDSKQSDYNFTKPYSDSTAEKIDSEVKRIVDNAYDRTKNLLLEKKEQLEKIAKKLLEKEILFQNDLEELIGKRPFENNVETDIEVDDKGIKENDTDQPSVKEE